MHPIITYCSLFVFLRYNPLWLYFHSPVAGFSLLVFEVSWSHTRHTTVGRTPLDEWSISHRDLWQHTTLTTDKHQCSQWDSNPQSQQVMAEDLRLRLCSHWDRLSHIVL